jgi:phage terminase small subunit
MTAEPKKRAKAAPEGLSAKGQTMWREVATSYQLRIDEYRILEDACREGDLIDALQAEAKHADTVVTGSQGQPVINPLISELRQHRSTLASLLRQLKLPDPADTAEARSTAARSAANARWSKRGA